MQGKKYKKQLIKGSNKKNNNYIKHDNRAYLKYKKYEQYQSDSNDNSSNESIEENVYKQHHRRINNKLKLKKFLQHTQYDKHKKINSGKCSSIPNRLTRNKVYDRVKKEDHEIRAELSDTMPATTAEDTIAQNIINTIVIDDDTKDIDTDSQEEGELRLIALKSAMIQRHLKRKKRNAELAYSPTAFDEMLTIVEASKSPNDIDVDLEDMVSEMEISPTTSPRLTPIGFGDENSAINTKPVDMDIANSESDNEAVIYSGTNVDWPVPIFEQNIEQCNVDIPTAMSYPIDYTASLQYGLFTPDIRYHLTSIPPPPLPPMFSDCMEPIAPPPIFSDISEIPPPPPPFHKPVEKQDDSESSLKEVTCPVLTTIDNVLEFKNITINDETDKNEEKTDGTNTNNISTNSTAEQQICAEHQNSVEEYEDDDIEEEEVALRALLLSKFQTSKHTRKSTHKNGISLRQTKTKPKTEEASVIAQNAMDKKQSILKEAVRRLKMKSENADISEKSKEQEVDNNKAKKNVPTSNTKVQKPKKVITSLDCIIRERIEQLMLEEELEMKANANIKENVKNVAVLETDAHIESDKEIATSTVVKEPTVQNSKINKESAVVTTVKNMLPANNLNQKYHNTNESNLQTALKPLVPHENHVEQQTMPSTQSTSSSHTTATTSIKELPANELINSKQITQPKVVSTTVSKSTNALKSEVPKTHNGQSLLNGIKNKTSNAAVLNSDTKLVSKGLNAVAVPQDSSAKLQQSHFTNKGSAFVPIVTKIVKPNKVINTNVNLKRKNVNNASTIASDSKQSKLSNELCASNDTFKLSKSVSPNAANTRLLSATDVAKRIVNKIVINLQTSESEKSDTDNGNDTDSNKICKDGLRKIENEYFDIKSPLSLAMGSRSTTPSRVNSPNASLDSLPTSSVIKNKTNDVFEQKIDDFLKNMRDRVQPMLETKKTVMNVDSTNKADTPLAVRHLPIAAQREYSRLRERMKTLEQQKETISNESTSSTAHIIQNNKIKIESSDAVTCKPTTVIKSTTKIKPSTASNLGTVSHAIKAISQTTHSNKVIYNNNNNKSCQTSLSNEKLTQNTAATVNNAVEVKNTLVKAVLLKNANTASIQTLPKATTKATNSVQDAKKLNILRAHEKTYNVTGAAIVNVINSSLGLVNDVKAAKIAEIKYEQEITALTAQLEKMKSKLKLEKEKLEKLRPEVCRSNELLTNLRQRRAKLFKAANNLGKVVHGDQYSLNSELNKEIKLKFNNLAKEIKMVNSINTKNVETLDVNKATMNRTSVTKGSAANPANAAHTKVAKSAAQIVEEPAQQILPIKHNTEVECNKPLIINTIKNASKSTDLANSKTNCSPVPSKSMASNAKVAPENNTAALVVATATECPKSKEEEYISFHNTDKQPVDVSKATAIYDEKEPQAPNTTHAEHSEDEAKTYALPNYVSALTQLSLKNSERKLDPFTIVCPYALMGECDDIECPYIHLDKTNNC